MRPLILIAVSLFALSGCISKNDPPDDAPTGVTATDGDGVILMTWDQLQDLTYWIFYAPGDSVSPGQVGTIAIKNAVSPRAVTGLVNGTKYSLLMNATNQDSAAGPNSQVVTATPRPAGDSWAQGAVQGPQNLNALAFNGAGRYVTVGDGTTLFGGDFNYGHTNPIGVTQWVTPTWFPPNAPATTVPPFTTDFKAVIFTGTFVALGSTGEVATSADGLNWTPQHRVKAAGVTGLNGLVFGFTPTLGAAFIAVGNGGQMYATSDLTIDWTTVASVTASDLTSIALLNGFLVVTGADGTLLVSPDGVSWTQQTTAPPLAPGTTLRSVTFMPNALAVPGSFAYVAVGDGNTVVTATQILKDVNNIPTGDWTVNPLPGPPNPPLNLRSVVVGGATGSRFLAVGQGGAVVFGDSVIKDVNGLPVAVNPIQWAVPSRPPTGDFSSVHFFLGQYLAVGAAGANAVSH